MQELEKILAEIDDLIVHSAWPCMNLIEKEKVKEIIRDHMNDKAEDGGWIPVEERLPDVPDNLDDDDCPEFNVTIKGANRATTLRCASDGTWFDEFGHIYPVIAWQPLPEPYPRKGVMENDMDWICRGVDQYGSGGDCGNVSHRIGMVLMGVTVSCND